MFRVYYSPDLDQFTAHDECGTVFTLPSQQPHRFRFGKRWIAINESGIDYMSKTIEGAISNPSINADKLSSAITGFYRARRCLETEGESEGFQSLLFLPWDRRIPEIGALHRQRG